jgi:cytosine/adenosine deaminase-related metal-dependent hydrolase
LSASTFVRSRYLLPIHRPPIENAWIEIARGRILNTGTGRPPGDARDLGDVAILPGLVNAHTHLELSWMAGRVPPAGSMDEWIRALMRVRREGAPGGPAADALAVHDAVHAMRATGTALVGDISNTLTTAGALREGGLGGVVFHELLGFAALSPGPLVRDAWHRVDDWQARLAAGASAPASDDGPAPIRFSVVAHAPYSCSSALLTEIARAARDTPLAVHLGESPEEIEFLRTGRGPIRQLLESLGVWTDAWRVHECDPVQYLANVGYLRPGVMVVHAVHLTDQALERLRRARAVVVTCPRSNEWVGAGPPRLAHFYAAGVPVAVGTDSLASSPSLNMFEELSEMRRIAPEVAAASLLQSATRTGAEALGFGRDYGTIEPGKRAALISVEIPGAITDVEEYLVGDVPASSVRPVTF